MKAVDVYGKVWCCEYSDRFKAYSNPSNIVFKLVSAVSSRTHSSILVPKSYYTHISLNFYYLGILFARHVDVTMTIVISLIRKNYKNKNRTNVSPPRHDDYIFFQDLKVVNELLIIIMYECTRDNVISDSVEYV